ncbi:MAG: helix-turn-helix domain-containing protein [Mycobacteriales bacterium]
MAAFIAREPPPRLRGLITRLWYGADAGSAGGELKLPALDHQLLINLDADRLTYREGHTGARAPSGVGLAVVTQRAVELDRAEQRRIAGAVLAPGAIPLLFGVPAAALSEPLVDATEFCGPDAGELRERCLDVTDADGVLALLADFLTPAASVDADAGLIAALRLLAAGRPVADVAERIGRSESGLLRAFHHGVGPTPKRAQRLLRLRRTVRAVRAGTDMASVAHVLGYADQAHLTHDFVDLTGLTPGTYRRGFGPAPMHVPLPTG